ncbi:MAG TPA: GH116 family glycosyl-hydrolase [Bryobacteraceae bacterium]|nr:GH116 family glycosyl-hydrolase [Bryobacteraceae bacterium]
MSDTSTGRRGFLKTVALAAGAPCAAQTPGAPAPKAEAAAKPVTLPRSSMRYPRVFAGRQLAMLAMPIGGIGTGSISLGGRGQLRDWEIFNRPDKGRSPEYAFASIWARAGSRKPVAHVLEARLMPPYEGPDGLGSKNAPGLTRLEGATFTGEFPLAGIAFHDSRLPVTVSLDAFSPFIPLDADDSGLPVAILRYRVHNPGHEAATVSIAWSLDNPIGAGDKRVNEYRQSANLKGLLMSNPSMAAGDPQGGTLALCMVKPEGKLTYLRGWVDAKWWTSPLLFWDDFGGDGMLGPESEKRNTTGALCLQQEIAPGTEAAYTFLLAWHCPNRTPAWSGWTAPKGDENTVIGNHYCTRFAGAWEAAEYAAAKLPDLEARTRRFAVAMRESTLPPAVRDAAMSTLSTLVTQTSFRTSDGEFHGFEGSSDHRGCCFGNCTHVWNYETATQHLFPTLARSLRKAAFGFSQDEQGGLRFRQMLPDGKDRFGYAAADGQMGQIIKAYLDWRMSGDTAWLRDLWPRIQRAVAFAWVPGGWDAQRRGVLDGVQHNTYDVEFYGPNPLCGIYYLGALRAAEEMARALGDTHAADEYHQLFAAGSKWIDANLFNGHYYIQKVRGIPKDQIAQSTVGDMGAENPDKPEYQVGDGCLLDQLMGQYLAEVAGLGPLVDPAHIRETLKSIWQFNYKRQLYEHDSVQRTYVLNDEAALVVCDYGTGKRPEVPFPYFSEAWTGLEYQAAATMIYAGMVREGVETFENSRRRYDGERRNPWDEAECGHHYARAMSAWSGVLALSGFRYHGGEKSAAIMPRLNTGAGKFVCFWSAGPAWGTFTHAADSGRRRVTLAVTEGRLPLRSITLAAGPAATASATLQGRAVTLTHDQAGAVFTFAEEITIHAGEELVLLA